MIEKGIPTAFVIGKDGQNAWDRQSFGKASTRPSPMP